MNTIRILVADDHAITREGLCRYMDEADDLEVIGQAADGEEALRLVHALRPDILLLDISMPRLDGVAVARALQATPSETRIVILTGYGESVEYARALPRLGVKGYLSKTASSGEVIGAIRAVYAGKDYMQPAVADLLAASPEQDTPEPPTARELDVLRLVAQGHGNTVIARQLHITERTVQFHLTNVFTKLNAASRTEAVHLARQRQWLP